MTILEYTLLPYVTVDVTEPLHEGRMAFCVASGLIYYDPAASIRLRVLESNKVIDCRFSVELSEPAVLDGAV